MRANSTPKTTAPTMMGVVRGSAGETVAVVMIGVGTEVHASSEGPLLCPVPRLLLTVTVNW